MTTEFGLFETFQPFYKAGKSICVTSDGFIIADDGENINYINKSTFQKVDNLNDRNEEVTCFVANPIDYTVIFANKNLMLRKIDRFNPEQRHKTWNSYHTAPITAMCLNKTSTRLTTGGSDNKVRVWHIGQGEGNSYSCIFHKSKINIVKNHPSSSFVVSSSLMDYEVVAWHTESGKQLGVFVGHQNTVTGIDFHDESFQMITSSRDETVIIWDCKTFAKLSLIPTMESVECCVVITDFMNQPQQDDYLIMVGGANGVMKTLSVHKRSIVQEFKKASLFANLNTDSTTKNSLELNTIRSILNVDDSIIVVRQSDNIECYNKQMQLQYELAGELSEINDIVMIGQNRDILLAVESAPYLRLFDCKSYFNDATIDNQYVAKLSQWPCQLISGGHSKEITCVAVSSDGLMVVSGAKDGKICIWRVETDNKLQLKLVTSLENENNFVRSICIDRTDSMIYVNYTFNNQLDHKFDGTLTVLSLANDILTKIFVFNKPHTDVIAAMDINVNNSLLATASKDKTAKIWSYQSKEKELIVKGVLRGHKRGLWSVKFSELEQLLLTSSMDKTIKLWSIEDFSCVSTFQSDHIIYKAMFYNNEKQIISCDEHGLINVWHREKRNIIKNFDVHNESIDCFTLMKDKENKVLGFAAAGRSSMICLYKDVTETHQANIKVAQELDLQNQQELDNLLIQNQFSRALKLAIKLNKPLSAYKILSKIQESETEIVKPMKPIEISEKTKVGIAINNLEEEELQKLFIFAIKWNTNARTFLIGQRVITAILCLVPNSELTSWPDFIKHIEALHAYSTRYYRRLKEEGDRMAFFDYLQDVMNTYKIIDLTMDTL